MWKDHLNVITRNSEGEKTNEEKRSKKVEVWKWSKKKLKYENEVKKSSKKRDLMKYRWHCITLVCAMINSRNDFVEANVMIIPGTSKNGHKSCNVFPIRTFLTQIKSLNLMFNFSCCCCWYCCFYFQFGVSFFFTISIDSFFIITIFNLAMLFPLDRQLQFI